jgi:magnesium transporter
MLRELLTPEITELIHARKWHDLKEVLSSWPSPEIVDLLLNIDKQHRVIIFRALPREISTEVFANLDYDQRDDFLRELTDSETRRLLADLPPDDRTDLLEELPAKATKRMLNLLNPDDLKEARTLLGYPDESVGRQMTPDFVAVRPHWTLKHALDHIRKYGKNSETINRVYIIDKDGKLLDDILLRNIIIADENERVSSLMDYNAISLSAYVDQEEAVRMMEKYDLMALPVVDSQGVLVGIVTFDDVLDISEEEATEDFQRIGGMNPVEQTYLSAGIGKLWVKRIPWLIALLFGNFFTVGALSYYHDIFDPVIMSLLMIFQPMLIGTAGNSGTQSSTLVIRSIVTDGLEFSLWWRVMLKELSVGLLLGLALGGIAYLRGYYQGSDDYKLAIVVSSSMFIMVIWANIIGGILPLILSKFNLDPAVISSPFMATLIDFTGIIIYFTIALQVFSL